MWRDDYKRRTITNIIIGLLCAVLLVGIVIAMLVVKEKNEAEDEKLALAQSVQQEEQAIARQEGLTAIQAEYEKDLQAVQQYLPGIVCWGDSLTAGSSGNVSYPYILQKYIDTYICNVYNFRLSIPNAAEYSRLNWNDYKVSIPVVNMGGGKESTGTTLGRSGVVPYVVSESFVIPAETVPVQIKFTSGNGKEVNPLSGGDIGVNNVIINGIEGKLTVDTSVVNAWTPATYCFTRSVPGESLVIDVGTMISTSASELYKDYIHVICMGTYKGYDTAEELVAQTRQLVGRQTSNSDRYIILGICSYDGMYTGGYLNLDQLDTAMAQEFGNRYISVRKYLCEDGLADYGITATQQDLMDVKNYTIPTSLRSAANPAELNGRAYELIGKLVYDRMDRLGYFDEIRQELYIDEAITELQKTDPTYFTRLMRDKTSLLK